MHQGQLRDWKERLPISGSDDDDVKTLGKQLKNGTREDTKLEVVVLRTSVAVVQAAVLLDFDVGPTATDPAVVPGPAAAAAAWSRAGL